MIFFKNADLYTVEQMTTKNKLGQIVKSLIKSNECYKVNRQVIDEKAIKYTWGSDIKSTIQIFADIDLDIEDLVVIDYKGKEKVYKIENKKDYDNHYIYALFESDEQVI